MKIQIVTDDGELVETFLEEEIGDLKNRMQVSIFIEDLRKGIERAKATEAGR